MAKAVNISLCSQRQGDPTSLLKVQSLTHLLKKMGFSFITKIMQFWRKNWKKNATEITVV